MINKEDKEIIKGEYKYTAELHKGISDYGKYEQYVDLRELYNQQKKATVIEIGIIDGEDDFSLVPGINVVAGMTGHGKSMFANSLAYRAVKKGLNVCYITLEVTKENMFYQMLSIYSYLEKTAGGEPISHSKIKKRELSLKQEDYVFDGLWPKFKELKGDLHILSEWDFDTTSTASLQQKLMEVEDYSKAKSGKGIDILIVDYIQLFKAFKEAAGTGEYNVLTQWVNEFRKMSLNYLGEGREIPVVMLSQLNRDALMDDKNRYKYEAKNRDITNWNNSIKESGEYQVGKTKLKKDVPVPSVTLGLSQIAGSVEIAKAAKQVFTIYVDENLKASEQCTIQVLKNRDGRTAIEPRIVHMNPVYYWVGKFVDNTQMFEGNLDDIGLGSFNAEAFIEHGLLI